MLLSEWAKTEWTEWGKWFRSNADKFLVAACAAGLLMYNLHILHHGADQTQLQFINALVNNLQGAFLTLVTGAVVRGAMSASTKTTDTASGNTVVTATTATKENGE